MVFRFLTYIYLWVNSRSRHGSASSLGNSTNLDVLAWPLTQISRSLYYSTSNNSTMVRHRAILTMADEQKVIHIYYRWQNAAVNKLWKKNKKHNSMKYSVQNNTNRPRPTAVKWIKYRKLNIHTHTEETSLKSILSIKLRSPCWTDSLKLWVLPWSKVIWMVSMFG